MDSEKFDLVFSGQVANGHELAQVKKNVAQLFRIDAGKVEALFSGKPIVLKKSLDAETANKYRVAMKKAGALVKVVESSTHAEPAKATVNPVVPKLAPSSTTAQSSAPASRAESTPVAGAEFTTSAGAGGSASAAPVPSVVAPNFGIAARGADLLADSEKRQIKPVKVDISGLSLAAPQGNLVSEDEIKRPKPVAVSVPKLDVAAAGSDVLKPEERVQVKPVAVDTSKLSVAAPGERLAPTAGKAPPAPNVDHLKLAKE